MIINSQRPGPRRAVADIHRRRLNQRQSARSGQISDKYLQREVLGQVKQVGENK